MDEQAQGNAQPVTLEERVERLEKALAGSHGATHELIAKLRAEVHELRKMAHSVAGLTAPQAPSD